MPSSSDLAWQSVELQIEALIPGILLAAETKMIAHTLFRFDLSGRPWIPTSDFIRGATFIAGAYALGLSSTMISRALLDKASESGPRSWFLRLFAHGDLDKLTKHFQENDQARFLLDLGLDAPVQQGAVAQKSRKERWNAVYRSALRKTSRTNEVDRRRAQGRLLRNLFLPCVLAPWALATPSSPSALVLVGWSVAAGLVAFALYVYSEVVIFAEAHDISDTSLRSS